MQFEEWPQYSGGMAGSCYRQPSFRKRDSYADCTTGDMPPEQAKLPYIRHYKPYEE